MLHVMDGRTSGVKKNTPYLPCSINQPQDSVLAQKGRQRLRNDAHRHHGSSCQTNCDVEEYIMRSTYNMDDYVCRRPSLARPPRCPLGALISTRAAAAARRKWVSFTHDSVDDYGHFGGGIRFWETLGEGRSDGGGGGGGAMHHPTSQ